MEKGIYRIVSTVQIRRGARIVEYKDANGKPTGNIEGKYFFGRRVEVLEVITDKNGMTWGRVSEDTDATGEAQWICLKTANRTFALPVEPTQSERLAMLERRVKELELAHGWK